MAFQPLDLGQVYASFDNQAAAQQHNQLAAMQIQQAQQEVNDQSGIRSLLSNNPDASIGDLARYGQAGIQTAGQLGQVRAQDAAQQQAVTKQAATRLYTRADLVANSDKPKQFVQDAFPEMVQEWNSAHPQMPFESLNDAQVKNFANVMRAHAQTFIGQGPASPNEVLQSQTSLATNAATVAATERGQDFTAQTARRGQSLTDARAKDELDFKKNPFGNAISGSAGSTGPTGDEFLKTLPSNIAIQVKAIADGRMPFPSGMALKTPYWQGILQAVSQYDPNFDAVNFNARNKTRADFTSGKSAQNIKSLNTAIGHAGTLDSQIDDTASHSFTPFNFAENQVASMLGSPGPGVFRQTAAALASELTTAFRGQGGAEQDVVRNLGSLSENDSRATKKAVLKNAVDLLNSRLEAVGDQYNNGMGTTKDPLTLLNPHAAATFGRLRGGAAASSGSDPLGIR